ncbi:MAG: hypothetical protein P8018_02660 [Acidobacteriota bacterium]|jgi:hypothetical protein
MTRRWRSILLTAAAFGVLSCSGSVSGGKPAAEGSRQPKGHPGSKQRAAQPIPVINLQGLFASEAQKERGAPRNLFAFEQDPAVLAAQRRKAEEARRRSLLAQKKAEQERLKREKELAKNPPPPQPPAIPFQFVGYLGYPQDRIGVFVDHGGKDIYLAKAGQKINGTFIIRDVGYESAEVGFVGFQQTQRLALASGGGR